MLLYFYLHVSLWKILLIFPVPQISMCLKMYPTLLTCTLIQPDFPKCSRIRSPPFPTVLSWAKSTSINLVAKNICNFFFSVDSFLSLFCQRFFAKYCLSCSVSIPPLKSSTIAFLTANLHFPLSARIHPFVVREISSTSYYTFPFSIF